MNPMTPVTDLPSSPAPSIPQTVLGEHTVALLADLLAIVEEFLRTAGPNVHTELRDYLAGLHPSTEPLWLIDMLGFNALHLRHRLRPTAPSARENWQPRQPLTPVTFDPTGKPR